MSHVPERIGEYDVLRVIGEGGMGTVYEGRQPDIGKRVAIKVLRADASDDAELVERFVGEARAVNEVRHRNVVDIFSFGTLPDGRHYLVMELLEGRSLETVIRQDGRVALAPALAWTSQILEALDAAHRSGVIHRDLKPSNLFIVEQRRQRSYVKLLDFGIAKLLPQARRDAPLTRVSMIIGTPDYMSPEQAKAQPVTPASDLYSLGCVMFEMLSGQRPFVGRTSMETMAMHLETAPPRLSDLVPGVSKGLNDLVSWLMNKDPGARPASADAVLEYVLGLEQLYPDRTPLPEPVKDRPRISTITDDPPSPPRGRPKLVTTQPATLVSTPVVTGRPQAQPGRPPVMRSEEVGRLEQSSEIPTRLERAPSPVEIETRESPRAPPVRAALPTLLTTSAQGASDVDGMASAMMPLPVETAFMPANPPQVSHPVNAATPVTSPPVDRFVTLPSLKVQQAEARPTLVPVAVPKRVKKQMKTSTKLLLVLLSFVIGAGATNLLARQSPETIDAAVMWVRGLLK